MARPSVKKIRELGEGLTQEDVLGRIGMAKRLIGEGKWKNRGLSKFNRVAEIMSILFAPERHVVGMAIVHDPHELIEMVNACLNEDERICERTFERYLKGESMAKWADQEIAEQFMTAYKLAKYEQKQRLFQLLAEDQPGGWQRWTWILERRFDEWNLRNKVVDETPDMKRLVLKVKAPETD